MITNLSTAEVTPRQNDPASQVYSRLAADPMLAELVSLFVEEMPDKIKAFEVQAKNRDWRQLARTAHQLKGAAGSYGFHAITPYAARLEAAARDAKQEESILLALDELLNLCMRIRCGTEVSTVLIHS